MKRLPGFLLLALLAGGPMWSAQALDQGPVARSAAPSATCENALTTPQINDCARERMDAAEATLNEVYARIRADLKSPDCGINCAETREMLTLAQRQWVQFRLHDCEAVWQYHADGTIRTVANLACVQRRAEDRTRQLRDTYEPDR